MRRLATPGLIGHIRCNHAATLRMVQKYFAKLASGAAHNRNGEKLTWRRDLKIDQILVAVAFWSRNSLASPLRISKKQPEQ
jgi:hypothetical protein